MAYMKAEDGGIQLLEGIQFKELATMCSNSNSQLGSTASHSIPEHPNWLTEQAICNATEGEQPTTDLDVLLQLYLMTSWSHKKINFWHWCPEHCGHWLYFVKLWSEFQYYYSHLIEIPFGYLSLACLSHKLDICTSFNNSSLIFIQATAWFTDFYSSSSQHWRYQYCMIQ